jgi:hypothetical protein
MQVRCRTEWPRKRTMATRCSWRWKHRGQHDPNRPRGGPTCDRKGTRTTAACAVPAVDQDKALSLLVSHKASPLSLSTRAPELHSTRCSLRLAVNNMLECSSSALSLQPSALCSLVPRRPLWGVATAVEIGVPEAVPSRDRISHPAPQKTILQQADRLEDAFPIDVVVAPRIQGVRSVVGLLISEGRHTSEGWDQLPVSSACPTNMDCSAPT